MKGRTLIMKEKTVAKKNQLDYIKRYNAQHYTNISLKFRKDVDEDVEIVKFLRSQPSTAEYIRELVRKEMKKK